MNSVGPYVQFNKPLTHTHSSLLAVV